MFRWHHKGDKNCTWQCTNIFSNAEGNYRHFKASLVGSILVANFWIFRNFVSKKNGVVSALMMSKRFHCQRCQFCLLFHWLWHCGESLKSSTLRAQKGSNYTYERTLDLLNPLIELLLKWLDSYLFVIVSFLMLLINFSMQDGFSWSFFIWSFYDWSRVIWSLRRLNLWSLDLLHNWSLWPLISWQLILLTFGLFYNWPCYNWPFYNWSFFQLIFLDSWSFYIWFFYNWSFCPLIFLTVDLFVSWSLCFWPF